MALEGGPWVSAGIRLRPMGIGDVLDETFRAFRRQFVPFVVAMAVVEVPLTLVGIAFNVAVGVAGAQGWLDRIFTPDGNVRTENLAALVVGGLAIGVVASLIFGLASAVRLGAIVALASDTALGRPVSVGAAYRTAFGRLGSILWGGFLSSLAVGLLALTVLGIPFAIYLGIGWVLLYQAVVLEGLGGRAGLSRSSSLVGGHRWHALATMILLGLLTWLLVSVPSGLTGVALGFFAGPNPSVTAQTAANVVNTLASAVGQVLFGALGFIASTILYYDMLARKEELDLGQRVEQAKVEPGPPAERG
jgi:hypothetical protein